MTISAQVIADSCQGFDVKLPVAGQGYRHGSPRLRLTTFELRYPRFIHAELMTHRVFSRNASSSRAIPIQKLIDEVQKDPAMPVFWGKNQAGMQAREELSRCPAFDVDPMAPMEDFLSPFMNANIEWSRARDFAVHAVKRLMTIGLHKQLANRLLEPWSHITVLVTSTDWANWYALRNHPDAQPEMKALAEVMLIAHRGSTPQALQSGDWHLPYVTDLEKRLISEGLIGDRRHLEDPLFLPKLSAARCARVSYLKHDGGEPTYAEDLILYDRLMGGNPKHASPTEHQARVPVDEDYDSGDDFRHPSNLCRWTQHRKLIEGESTNTYEEFER